MLQGVVWVEEAQSKVRKNRIGWVGRDKQVNSWCLSVKNKGTSTQKGILSQSCQSFLNSFELKLIHSNEFKIKGYVSVVYQISMH